MPEIKWTANVQVSGGTTMTVAADAKLVEAIDTVEVVLSPGDKDKVLDIQPGGASAIHLLVIKSSIYSEDLSYKASDGKSESPAIVLDAPQVFSHGCVALFDVDPHQLKFSMASTGKKATVLVFVGRDATP